MKTKGRLKLLCCFVVLPLIIIFQGCNNNDLITNYDISYPTAYQRLDNTTINQMQTAFAKANPYISSTITEFGFCGFFGNISSAQWPQRDSDLSMDEALEILKTFALQNTKQLGISNPNDLTIINTDTFRVYDRGLAWSFVSSSQKYNGIEVYNSNILFHIINGKMTYCIGNWYPKIYIPPKINVDYGRAKLLLLDKKVYISDIAGKSTALTITSKSLQTAIFDKLIYPVETDTKIELHVVWKIDIPEVFYVIFLDVMTGEMVNSYPTIIS